MTADLTILPVGGNAHLATVLADVLRAVRRQGITYQLTGTTTCLEGTWEQIVGTARACHEICRAHSPHVVTLLRIEDDIEGGNDLQSSIQAVKDLADENFNSRPPADISVPLTAEVRPGPAVRA